MGKGSRSPAPFSVPSVPALFIIVIHALVHYLGPWLHPDFSPSFVFLAIPHSYIGSCLFLKFHRDSLSCVLFFCLHFRFCFDVLLRCFAFSALLRVIKLFASSLYISASFSSFPIFIVHFKYCNPLLYRKLPLFSVF